MMKNFRKYHLLNILQNSENASLPLDAFLRDYFRKNKAVGSKDRQEICTSLYKMIRWLALIDAHTTRPRSWEKRLETHLSLSKKNHSA